MGAYGCCLGCIKFSDDFNRDELGPSWIGGGWNIAPLSADADGKTTKGVARSLYPNKKIQWTQKITDPNIKQYAICARFSADVGPKIPKDHACRIWFDEDKYFELRWRYGNRKSPYGADVCIGSLWIAGDETVGQERKLEGAMASQDWYNAMMSGGLTDGVEMYGFDPTTRYWWAAVYIDTKNEVAAACVGGLAQEKFLSWVPGSGLDYSSQLWSQNSADRAGGSIAMDCEIKSGDIYLESVEGEARIDRIEVRASERPSPYEVGKKMACYREPTWCYRHSALPWTTPEVDDIWKNSGSWQRTTPTVSVVDPMHYPWGGPDHKYPAWELSGGEGTMECMLVPPTDRNSYANIRGSIIGADSSVEISFNGTIAKYWIVKSVNVNRQNATQYFGHYSVDGKDPYTWVLPHWGEDADDWTSFDVSFLFRKDIDMCQVGGYLSSCNPSGETLKIKGTGNVKIFTTPLVTYETQYAVDAKYVEGHNPICPYSGTRGLQGLKSYCEGHAVRVHYGAETIVVPFCSEESATPSSNWGAPASYAVAAWRYEFPITPETGTAVQVWFGEGANGGWKATATVWAIVKYDETPTYGRAALYYDSQLQPEITSWGNPGSVTLDLNGASYRGSGDAPRQITLESL